MGLSTDAAAPPFPSLIVLTDWALGEDVLLRRLESVAAVSPRIALQLRRPGASAAQLYRHAEQLSKICARHGNPLIVGERLDLALAFDAHLHLPAHGLLPATVRPHLPAHRWLSCAVHKREEALGAVGASYALVSPVFRPTSKPDDTREPLGAAGFQTLAAHLSCPAVALGGIDVSSAVALPNGVGLAVIGGVLNAKDPAAAAFALSERSG